MSKVKRYNPELEKDIGLGLPCLSMLGNPYGEWVHYQDYAELKAQRDALAANEGYKQAFYEMADILGIGARADSPKNVFDLVIKPKLEALMKDRGKLASENITLAGLVTSWPQERCPVTEAVTDVQPDDLFPETNTYLNSVRAEGAASVGTLIRACAHEFPDSAEDIVEECALIADNKAVSLRAVRDK